MRHALVALFVLLACAQSAAAQQVPGTNTPFGGLARQLAGIEFIKAEISDLRRELSRCDGPPASKSGACASRALLQAKLNYLLEVSTMLGDPDTAGAPPKAAPAATDPSDYQTELRYLQEQLASDRSGFYVMSENRAKSFIIQHCQAMHDLERFTVAFMTSDEVVAYRKDVQAGRIKAAINDCIKGFDAKEIVANRKAALEYCVPATTEKYGARTLLGPCMVKHDILQALCKQELELHVAWSDHRYPEQRHAPQGCPLDRVRISPSETDAIMALPRGRTMPELPAKFFAPPNVAVPPRPPLAIPAGTTIEVKLPGSWDGFAIDNPANPVITANLQQPLVIGGKTVLQQYTNVTLKTRILGPSQIGERPERVQIGFTTDEVNIDAPDCRVCGKWADLKSNEVVFTVPYLKTAQDQGLPLETIVRFTIGGSGSVEMPSAQKPGPQPTRTQPPARPAPTAPPPTAGPATAPPPSPAADPATRAQRVQACVIQAIKDHPNPLEQGPAIAACAQIK
jgi:hypothetical protein